MELDSKQMLHIDGDVLLGPSGRRENFIPVHTRDLVKYLSQHPALSVGEKQHFERLSALVQALLHHLYRQRHEQLTYVYAPLDPDRDRLLRTVPTREFRNELAAELFERTQDALHRANYHRLTPYEIQQALNVSSRWGVRMRVGFSMLKRLEIYGRGLVIGKRKHRDWRNFFRLTEVDVPLYQRLIVIFRTTEDLQSDQFDKRWVYLRMFKNVPQQDIDMMLPAQGVRMSWLDHSRIVVPSLYGAVLMMWRFLKNVVLLAFFGVFKTLGLIVLAIFAIGFGLRSMFTYRSNTQQRYMLNMTQSLYFQSLDCNAGVLLRLLDEGEQQEACEAVLAYFVAAFLHRGESLSLADLDLACEEVLAEQTGSDIDFDIDRTCRILVQIGALKLDEKGFRAVPVSEALAILNEVWDDRFTL